LLPDRTSFRRRVAFGLSTVIAISMAAASLSGLLIEGLCRDGAWAREAFPSRIDRPRVPGSAARGAEKRLRRMGFRVVAPAESFYVTQHERTACPKRGRVRRELGRAVGPAFRADQRGEAFRDGLSLGP
jgi:hypothetical protein